VFSDFQASFHASRHKRNRRRFQVETAKGDERRSGLGAAVRQALRALGGVHKRAPIPVLFPGDNFACAGNCHVLDVSTTKAVWALAWLCTDYTRASQAASAFLRVRISESGATAQHAGVHRHCSGLSEGSDANVTGTLELGLKTRREVAGLAPHRFTGSCQFSADHFLRACHPDRGLQSEWRDLLFAAARIGRVLRRKRHGCNRPVLHSHQFFSSRNSPNNFSRT